MNNRQSGLRMSPVPGILFHKNANVFILHRCGVRAEENRSLCANRSGFHAPRLKKTKEFAHRFRLLTISAMDVHTLRRVCTGRGCSTEGAAIPGRNFDSTSVGRL